MPEVSPAAASGSKGRLAEAGEPARARAARRGSREPWAAGERAVWEMARRDAGGGRGAASSGRRAWCWGWREGGAVWWARFGRLTVVDREGRSAAVRRTARAV